jgi:outer membrane protein insertion porin family
LYQTGLFDNVALSSIDSAITDSKVPIKLQGSIGKMNELSPELILNNQQSALNVGSGASYIRKNFLGNARKLTVSSSFAVQNIFNVDFKNLIKNFSFRDTTLLGYVDSRITIEQPYLFNKPIFGTWQTYAKIDKQSTYNNTVYGSSITFDFEMPEYTFINHLSSSYTLEQSNEVYRTNNDSLSTKLVSDIGADASSTTADNILFPTQGYNLSFHIEEGNSFPHINSSKAGFYKLQLGDSYYFSLDQKRNSIAAFKIKIGDIQVFYGSFAGVPINRTFYAGGSNSIRGWQSNELVPVGSQVVQGIEGGTSIKGGTFLLEGSLEWRYRFVESMGVAFFSDFGNTWLGYKQYSWKGVALATGFGFRYYTPIAPFRVDFGFKLFDPSKQLFLWKNWNKAFFKNIAFQFGLGEAF